MIGETLSLLVCVLAGQRLPETDPPDSIGFDPVVESQTRDVTFYGSGKTALRDGVASFAEPDANVLVPAYLPDAVGEPFRELGLETRYYRIHEDLEPDPDDVERRIDSDTAAVMSVNYFGFPQPGLDDLVSLIDEYGCYHIDDNAHGPLSVADGTLLGTRGDLGITSLYKLLPVPNGAILYCNSEQVSDRFEPSSLAGVRRRLDTTDCRFLARSLATDVIDSNRRVRCAVNSVVAHGGNSPSVASPADRYERGKRRMSTLSARVLSGADPDGIRSARRENYRTWRRTLADRDDLNVRWDVLPEGVCPQAFPVRTPEPERLLADLERAGVHAAHTWPRLPGAVRADETYEAARTLARETVVLPVHQWIDPPSIEAAGERLSG